MSIKIFAKTVPYTDLLLEKKIEGKINNIQTLLYPKSDPESQSELYDLVDDEEYGVIKIENCIHQSFKSGMNLQSAEMKINLKPYDFYFYKDYIYYFEKDDPLTEKQRLLSIVNDYYTEQKKFDDLEKKVKIYEEIEKIEIIKSSEPISEEVKILVWKRDEGKCVKCRSQSELEYDHIIPVSRGGSNTERNIQLLCLNCIKEKLL